MDSLFGEDFNIDITKTKAEAKRIAKQLEKQKLIEEDPEKYLKSKALSLIERLAIIKERVLKVLGKQRQNTIVIKTKEEFSTYIDKAIKNGIIAVDTETNNTTDAVNCKIMGLCLYTPNEKQAYIPINHTDLEDNRLIWQLTEQDCKKQLQRLLDAKTYILMHNGKFDYEVIKCTCDIAVAPAWDTLIGTRLIDENEFSDKRTSLKYLYTTLIDPTQTRYDIEGLFGDIPYNFVEPEIFALYASSDSMMTYKLYLWEKQFFDQEINKKVKWVADTIEMPLVEVTAKMEMRGITIDQVFAQRLKDKYNLGLNELDKKINEELESLKPQIDLWKLSPEANEKSRQYVAKKTKMTLEKQETIYNLIDENGNRYKENKPKVMQLADPINLASPTQLAILFYDILKCPIVNKEKPRATGEDELKAIHEKLPDLKLCSLMLERRGLVKIITSFIDVIPELAKHWKDGRIRFRLNSYGTNTGRYAAGGKYKALDSEGKSVIIDGINIQQIPTGTPIREMFKASEEYSNIVFEEDIFNVPEITEIETPEGYKFCKDLQIGNKIIIDENEVIIKNITYNNKEYQIQI